MPQYTDEELAEDIAASGKTAPRITAEHLDSKISSEDFHVFPGTTMTVCLLTLENGYHTIGYSASASAENFDPEIGRKLARDHARNEIWRLEGYLLRQRLYEES
jgi:hypothetical protein